MRLKGVVGSLFHEDMPHDYYVMGLMADAVVHSKDGRAALEKSVYMKEREGNGAAGNGQDTRARRRGGAVCEALPT